MGIAIEIQADLAEGASDKVVRDARDRSTQWHSSLREGILEAVLSSPFSIFVSSAFGGDGALQEIRARFHDWANGKFQVWMFEHYRSETEWRATPLSQSISICLTELEKSDAYVGLIHEAYGGSARSHVAGIAFTDLEVFHAIRLGKPMLFYVLEPSARTSETDSLLTILQHVVPDCFKGVGNVNEVLEWLKHDALAISLRKAIPSRLRLGKFLSATAQWRWREIVSNAGTTITPPDLGLDADISSTQADDWLRVIRKAESIDKGITLLAALKIIFAGRDRPGGKNSSDA